MDETSPDESSQGWVCVQPGGAEIEVAGSESLIEAAWREGYYWPTVCGGRAECTACVMRIVSGGESAPPPGEREAQQLETVRQRTRNDDDIRLACCFRPEGRVVVEKKGVRRRLA